MPAMPTLPDDVQPYRRTPAFTEATLPAGLRRAHTTKPGVWARIVVESGALVYRIREGEGGVFRLEPGTEGIVRPTESHDVQPDGPVRFHVVFLATAPSDATPSTGLESSG